MGRKAKLAGFVLVAGIIYGAIRYTRETDAAYKHRYSNYPEQHQSDT